MNSIKISPYFTRKYSNYNEHTYIKKLNVPQAQTFVYDIAFCSNPIKKLASNQSIRNKLAPTEKRLPMLSGSSSLPLVSFHFPESFSMF